MLLGAGYCRGMGCSGGLWTDPCHLCFFYCPVLGLYPEAIGLGAEDSHAERLLSPELCSFALYSQVTAL